MEDFPQFISYFYQTSLVLDLKPKKVLEVGVGNKTTSDYLRRSGLEVTTCDIDGDKEPNYVADIRQLPFEDDTFDAVIVFEVLEHLPWSDVNKALEEIQRTTKRYVVCSVPHVAHHFELVLKFPLMRKIFKKDSIDLFFRVPVPIRDFKTLKEGHHWEIGRKSHPMQNFTHLLENKFSVLKEVRPTLNQYHHFFVLEKIPPKKETRRADPTLASHKLSSI
ncbi:MAG: class I SAM-dependent methyltransferase [Thaumarchaeota archaeon]|nr:class I SAM-dependent methyltransferase [Nitrososphaerota archaeon]